MRRRTKLNRLYLPGRLGNDPRCVSRWVEVIWTELHIMLPPDPETERWP